MAVIKYEKRYTVPNDQPGIKDFVSTYAEKLKENGVIVTIKESTGATTISIVTNIVLEDKT